MKLLVFILAIILTILTTSAHAERRAALVIGNSAYRSVSPLANPKNDARLMARVLKRAGFSVTVVLNTDYRRLRKAIIDFGQVLEKADVGLLYYAGHGVQRDGGNYLIPIDAKLIHQDYLEIEAVNVNQALKRMGKARNRLNILILDACRNNPFPAFSRASSRGLAVTQAPAGTYIAYATRPGAVAEDGGGKHSPFTAALSRRIPLAGASLEQVFKQVRADVREQTKGRQIPWTSSSIEGEFFFHQIIAKKDGSNKLSARTAWNLIASSQEPAVFQAFRRQFPNSPEAKLADRRVANLEELARSNSSARDANAKKERRLQQAHSAWQLVQNTQDPATLSEYLRFYPDSQFSTRAKAQLESLQQRIKLENRRLLLARRQPSGTVPIVEKLLPNRFNGHYGGIEKACSNGTVEWHLLVRGLKVSGRVHYNIAGNKEVYAFNGTLSGRAGLLQLQDFENDRGLKFSGVLLGDFDGICGPISLTKANYNSAKAEAPVFRRNQDIAGLPALTSGDLLGRWSNECHSKFARSIVITPGRVEFWNGLRKWEDWSYDEPIVNGGQATLHLSVGIFSIADIILKQASRRALRLLRHNLEIRKEVSNFRNSSLVVRFFEPGSLLDRCL